MTSLGAETWRVHRIGARSRYTAGCKVPKCDWEQQAIKDKWDAIDISIDHQDKTHGATPTK